MDKDLSAGIKNAVQAHLQKIDKDKAAEQRKKDAERNWLERTVKPALSEIERFWTGEIKRPVLMKTYPYGITVSVGAERAFNFNVGLRSGEAMVHLGEGFPADGTPGKGRFAHLTASPRRYEDISVREIHDSFLAHLKAFLAEE